MVPDLSNQQFRAIFDSAFEFIGLLAPDGTLLEVNRSALNFANVAAADVVGRRFWDTPWWRESADERDRLQRAVAEAAGGAFVRYETEQVGGDGRRIAVDFSLTPVRDAEGRVVCIVPEGRDVTERKRVEHELRLSEKKFQGILSIAADAIISIDGAQRIVLFNRGAEEIFGYAAPEVLGQLLTTLLPGDSRVVHPDKVLEFGAGRVIARRMGERGEIYGRRKNGEVFPAEASISRIDVGGERVFTAVLRDVSEARLAQAELARLYQESRRATVARDEVLGRVSHDLRNPLSAIAMCVSALRVKPAPAESTADSLIETVHGSVEMMQRLIQDLLDVASIEVGRFSVRRRPVVVAELLSTVVDAFRSDAAERGLTLRTAASPDLPGILADAQRLRQVLGNLIENALKFTPRGGSIAVSAMSSDSTLQLQVTDTGVGIPPDELPSIFDRFWHAERDSRERSTGLGLTIARGIVDAHGGRIEVRSTVGTGTTFTVSLPASPTDHPVNP
jgi:PAS domain S-box-containing protein